MNIPKVFLISDTHFYHGNIIKYCHRPYKDVEQMNIDIIHKWNSVIGKNDVVWHLGDFAFFSKKDHERVERIISKLNGTINLLLGNHDRHVCTDLKFWYDLGFGKVIDKPFVFMDKYILSHEPLITKNKIDVRGSPFKNIFGHTHNSNADFYALPPEGQKQWNSNNPEWRPVPDITKSWFNVSIEVIDYKPIAFEEIVQKMKDCK